MMLLTKELEILRTTSSKYLLEEKNTEKKKQKREKEEKKREEKRRKKIEFRTCRRKGKAVAMGCGSCYSRTTTEMCCRLKERDGMLLRAKKKE